MRDPDNGGYPSRMVEKTAVDWVAAYRDRNPGLLERVFSRATWLLIPVILVLTPPWRVTALLLLTVALITLAGIGHRILRDTLLTLVIAELVTLPHPDPTAHRGYVAKLLDICHPVLTGRVLRNEAQIRGYLQATARQLAVAADNHDCTHGHADWCRHRTDRDAWATWWTAPHTLPAPVAHTLAPAA